MTGNLSLLEQNRLLSNEVKRRIDQMAAINAVASAVGQSLNLDNTLETALQVVSDVTGAEACGISLIDSKAGEIVLRAQRGWIHDFVVSNPMRIPLGQGMSGEVIDTNNVVVDNDLDGTEQIAVPSFHGENFRAIAMAPMHARGRIIGILSIMSNTPNSFDEDIVSLLQVISDTVGVAVENARLYEDSVEQQTRVSAILHSTADGIIATDQNSCISLINQTAERMLDIRREDLIGVPLREAPVPVHMWSALAQALSSRNDNAFQVQLENGRVIEAMISPVYVESQVEQTTSMDGWVVVLKDVTHLREEEIARAEFIQAAAHDMRNPLSITLSSINLLDDMIPDKNETMQEIIDLAMGSVSRLHALIDDLLNLEHIESGYNINHEQVNLLDLLSEVSKEAAPLMRERKMRFTQDLPEALPTIEADANWLKRAVHNYLSNAAKYTPEGGEVTLRAYVQDAATYIEVVDNGPGIPAKAQPQLFERFYRVDGVEGVRGSGLGLAIVRSVAEAHGGRTYVNSKEGDGSSFGLELPIRP